MRLLLEIGASVNSKGRTYSNTLLAASCTNHEKTVLFSLEKGDNVNAEGGLLVHALSAASCYGHEGVVRLDCC